MHIPTVKEPPLIGSMFHLQQDRLGFLTHLAAYGPVVRCHLGPLQVIAINAPDYIHNILVEHASDTWKGWPSHRAFVGNGIFISEGDFHRHQRKIMAPSFQPRTISTYAETMTSYPEQLAASWQDGQTIDMSSTLAALTANIIGKTVFDLDLFDETTELGRSINTVFRHAAYMMSHPLALPTTWPFPRNVSKDQAWNILRTRITTMIEERRANPKNRIDLLSLLIQAQEEGHHMSNEQLVDESMTIFLGGQETVASALIWVWILLNTHPAIAQQVQQEVSLLNGQTPTLQDLPRLPLCLQVFKETLRLYSPAPALPRQALRDIAISDANGEQTYQIRAADHHQYPRDPPKPSILS